MNLRGATDIVRRVAFSPDGALIASGGDDDSAQVWSIETGRLLYKLAVPAHVAAMAFSPDGKFLVVTTADGAIQTLDSNTGELQNRSSP
jgi:WD40 repeat protein